MRIFDETNMFLFVSYHEKYINVKIVSIFDVDKGNLTDNNGEI